MYLISVATQMEQAVIDADKVCGSDQVFLLIYVHTAPAHYKRRTVIRQTWGDASQYDDVIVRLLFVMGLQADDATSRDALLFEAEQYGDILQVRERYGHS